MVVMSGLMFKETSPMNTADSEITAIFLGRTKGLGGTLYRVNPLLVDLKRVFSTTTVAPPPYLMVLLPVITIEAFLGPSLRVTFSKLTEIKRNSVIVPSIL